MTFETDSNASANIRISSRHSRMSEVFTVSPQPDQLPQGFLALFLRAWDGPPLPARPWSVEETDPETRIGGAFIVRDANGQALAYGYLGGARPSLGGAPPHARLVRRIAANITQTF
jgi:hypothetical protein